MNIQVLSASGDIFAGEIKSLAGKNKSGKFSILENHAHFIGIARGNIQLVLSNNTNKEINIDYGLVHCKNNSVSVYANLPEVTEA